MMDIFNFIGGLLGYVLYFCFMLVRNYAWAIILFTIIIKAVVFPTSIKQQRTMAKNARMSAKQMELREKYGNDRVKMNEEMQKLYEKEGISPTSGCLTTMLLPMILLLGVYQSVINPLTNTVEATTIQEQTEQVMKNLGAVLEKAGSSFEKAVKTTCFLADMNDFGAFNEIYGKYFTGLPARSCVAVKTLPKNVLVEVEVIAETTL